MGQDRRLSNKAKNIAKHNQNIKDITKYRTGKASEKLKEANELELEAPEIEDEKLAIELPPNSTNSRAKISYFENSK